MKVIKVKAFSKRINLKMISAKFKKQSVLMAQVKEKKESATLKETILVVGQSHAVSRVKIKNDTCAAV